MIPTWTCRIRNANFTIKNTRADYYCYCRVHIFQVRGIEITIVVLVLMVWIGAIIMFFNRWGKIRMLIPYQPDYKDTQLKVPGTGACNPASSCQNQTGTGFCCSQVSTIELSFFSSIFILFSDPKKTLIIFINIPCDARKHFFFFRIIYNL